MVLTDKEASKESSIKNGVKTLTALLFQSSKSNIRSFIRLTSREPHQLFAMFIALLVLDVCKPAITL